MSLHTSVFGADDGPPLLAILGITGHGGRFRRLAEEGWPHRRTVAVDLRGHGRSTPEPPWTLGRHVADLVDVLDGNGLDSVDVVGHSFGATIALTLLGAHPERVRRLVLLDPAIAQTGEWGLDAAWGAIDTAGFASIDEARAWRGGDLGPDHPAIVEEIDAHLEQGEDGRFRFRWSKPAVVAGWGEMCQPVPPIAERRPTLLVVATQAELVGESQRAALAGQLGGDLDVVDLDCGHMVYWERFDEIARLVDQFLG